MTDSSQHSKPDVSVIIVNYHSMKLIDDCISSIKQFNKSVRYEVIVVSNSEWGDNEKAVMEKHPEVQWINPGKNMGFAAANNIGADHASGEYLFFLNPDTLFVNDVLGHLSQTISEYPDAGLIGPLTLNPDGSHQPSVKNEFGMDHMLVLAFPFLKIFFRNKKFGHIPVKKTQFVEVINGSAMFIKRNLFFKIGKMNESFFMFWEENDLCKSVRKTGKRILFYDGARIIHLGGQTTRNVFIPMEIEKHRSQKRYLMKFEPGHVSWNRLLGAISYFWRTLGAILIFRKRKVSQFGNILFWYIFKYD